MCRSDSLRQWPPSMAWTFVSHLSSGWCETLVLWNHPGLESDSASGCPISSFSQADLSTKGNNTTCAYGDINGRNMQLCGQSFCKTQQQNGRLNGHIVVEWSCDRPKLSSPNTTVTFDCQVTLLYSDRSVDSIGTTRTLTLTLRGGTNPAVSHTSTHQWLWQIKKK